MRSFIHTFDDTIDQHIEKWPGWLELPMTVISFFGQPIITVGTLVGIGIFGISNQQNDLIIATIIGIITIVINSLLKIGIGRDRPKTKYAANMWIDTFSFPSGHSCGAVVAFGLLTYLLLPYISPFLAFIVIILCLSLITAIGISRVYLGAHYASDVIGGWIIGSIRMLTIFVIKSS